MKQRANKFRQRLQALEAKRNVQWALEGCSRDKERRVKATIVRIQAIFRGFQVRQSDIGIKVAAKCPHLFHGSIWENSMEGENVDPSPRKQPTPETKLQFQPQKKFPKKPQKGAIPIKLDRPGLGEQTKSSNNKAQVFNLKKTSEEGETETEGVKRGDKKGLRKQNAQIFEPAGGQQSHRKEDKVSSRLEEAKAKDRELREKERRREHDPSAAPVKSALKVPDQYDDSQSMTLSTTHETGTSTRHKHRHRVRRYRKDDEGKRVLKFKFDPAEEHRQEAKLRSESRMQAREAWSRQGQRPTASRLGSRASSRMQSRQGARNDAFADPFAGGDFNFVSMYDGDDPEKRGSMTQRAAWGEGDGRPNSAEIAAIRRQNRISLIRFPTKGEIKATVAIQRWWRRWWWKYFGKKKINNRRARLLAQVHHGHIVRRAFWELVIQKKISRISKTSKYQRVMRKAKARFNATRLGQAVRAINRSNQAQSYKRKVADVQNLIVKYTDLSLISNERNHLLFSLQDKATTLKTEYCDLLTTAELKIIAEMQQVVEQNASDGVERKLAANKSFARSGLLQSEKSIMGRSGALKDARHSSTKSLGGQSAGSNEESQGQINSQGGGRKRTDTGDRPWRRLTDSHSKPDMTRERTKSEVQSSSGTPSRKKTDSKSGGKSSKAQTRKEKIAKAWAQKEKEEKEEAARKRAEERAQAREAARKERQERLEHLAKEKARQVKRAKANEAGASPITKTPKASTSSGKKSKSAPVKRHLPAVSSPTKMDWSRVQSKIKAAITSTPVPVPKKKAPVKVVQNIKIDYSKIKPRIDFGVSAKDYKKLRAERLAAKDKPPEELEGKTTNSRGARARTAASGRSSKSSLRGAKEAKTPDGRRVRVREAKSTGAKTKKSKAPEPEEEDPEIGNFLTAVRGGAPAPGRFNKKEKSRSLLQSVSRKKIDKKVFRGTALDDNVDEDEEEAPEPAPKPAMTYSLSFDFGKNKALIPEDKKKDGSGSHLGTSQDLSRDDLSGSELSDSEASVMSASDYE